MTSRLKCDASPYAWCQRQCVSRCHLDGAVIATVQGMARPRGALTQTQLRMLANADRRRRDAEASYRAIVLTVMAEGASFAEVSKATGLSTNTLQRWKREASDD